MKPVQADVDYDIPNTDIERDCKLEVVKQGKASGWVLRDGEVWCSDDSSTPPATTSSICGRTTNGQEVYRDIDSNGNEKPDQCRWYHTGGSRWGVDSNEDGRIDRWNAISPEEASSEVVTALATGDRDRLKRVMLSDEEIEQLGLSGEMAAKVRKAQEEAAGKFDRLARASSRNQVAAFDGDSPRTIPGLDIAASRDLVLYLHATIIAEAAGQTKWLRAVEVVKVGDNWKLVDLPSLIESGRRLPPRVFSPLRSNRKRLHRL